MNSQQLFQLALDYYNNNLGFIKQVILYEISSLNIIDNEFGIDNQDKILNITKEVTNTFITYLKENKIKFSKQKLSDKDVVIVCQFLTSIYLQNDNLALDFTVLNINNSKWNISNTPKLFEL